MTPATLAILGPLMASALILLLRRFPAALALLGVVAGLGGAVSTLVRVAGGTRLTTELPGLPGFPLRLVAEPL
ncbi:hypothetical protein OFP26_39740, partial [Escherichia coli]|nr:hypothetical protein [Escherichia coli]